MSHASPATPWSPGPSATPPSARRTEPPGDVDVGYTTAVFAAVPIRTPGVPRMPSWTPQDPRWADEARAASWLDGDDSAVATAVPVAESVGSDIGRVAEMLDDLESRATSALDATTASCASTAPFHKGVRTINRGFKKLTRGEQLRAVETARCSGRPAVHDAITAAYVRRLGRPPAQPAHGTPPPRSPTAASEGDPSPLPWIDVAKGEWSYKSTGRPHPAEMFHYPAWPHYRDELGARAELAMLWY
eukprot:TRINITY_DN6335_c0_g1_i1.p2 TRINITY_DN6335_c0_g1~~TRINITY_DN6335_c0_g1_i1.p2  ORF type:complete len:246 (+),score=71.22 TRINITY_DN6335_c0_g1_i1:46-783(+)